MYMNGGMGPRGPMNGRGHGPMGPGIGFGPGMNRGPGMGGPGMNRGPMPFGPNGIWCRYPMHYGPMYHRRPMMGWGGLGGLFLLPAVLFGGWAVLAVLGVILGLVGTVIGGVFSGLSSLASGIFSGSGIAVGIIIGLVAYIFIQKKARMSTNEDVEYEEEGA